MVKGLSRLEAVLASVLSLGIQKTVDLPYTPCIFFFGEPEYPLNEE